jgi:hypothetical protein
VGSVGERRWIIALSVVDAVLITVLAVLVAGNVRSAPPSATPSVAMSTPTPTMTARQVEFTMPSGNIACVMSSNGVTCVIKNATFTVESTCGADAGHTVALGSDGVSTPCGETDVDFDAPELGYGSLAMAGEYLCQSAREGVKCTDAHGVGFQMSRSALTVLP